MGYRKLFCLLTLITLSSCNGQNNDEIQLPEVSILPLEDTYLSAIDSTQIKKELYEFASDEMKGREAGTDNEVLATDYLTAKYVELGIEPAGEDGTYLQEIPAGTFRAMEKTGHNVIAQIRGTEKPEEYIVLSAHLDHLGEKNAEIFNGADDDGSGTIAILNIAKAFKKAKDEGKGPKRSILFLHVTGEEKGLLGSKFYTENPLVPLKNTIANLNIDMIGRVDEKHIENPYFLYLIGANKLSLELASIAETVNKDKFMFELDYMYDSEDHPERLYYRSDHYNFAKNNIPVIFFFNGIHDDYHQASDTPEKINYPVLTKRTQYIFAIAWELANRKEALKMNE